MVHEYTLRLLQDNEVHIHWKGAAEIVLASCTKYMDEHDLSVELDEDKVCHLCAFTNERF